MNLRLFGCIAMGVFVIHLGAIMLWVHLRPQPKFVPPPPPNFVVRSQSVTDPQTGDVTIYREITVSTKLSASPSPTTAR